MSESGSAILSPAYPRPVALAPAVALIVLAFVAPPLSRAAAFAAAITGQAHVIDGDTVDVDGQRIRLEGIDAPESGQRCGRAWFGSWDCGKAAARALEALIGSGPIACERLGTDKYGRALGRCMVQGEELNAAMVRSGMAWAFVKYSNAYVREEAEAKAAHAGVWQGKAEAPWLYREERWQSAETAAPNGCAIKGNVTDKGHIYHMPWSPWYANVRVEPAKGERWFCSESEAKAAGWRGVY